MIKLDLSKYHSELKFSESGGKRYVFDPIRKSNFIVQQEELVRQSWIQYLLISCKIREASLSVEKQVVVNKLKKRIDLVYYSKGNPLVLFEFKSFNISINQNAAQQVANYNLQLKVPYIVISNGLDHFAFFVDFEKQTTTPLNDFSFLSELNTQG
ncbi:MAG: type I restriction enzyme HsdR N-terminal domain-containing protein [Saprospiraceae bacterium]|nr:type I restriction enzyme HsdR N-terminal domain-containing protein [Bacteroidia bacterium]NNL93754.1 type I restriction enzyme HsdR N-terminal domain-containing protein [Saprospiraceae bacterium]